MKPLFNYPFTIHKQIKEYTHCRVFIVLPHSNPIIRGKMLQECLHTSKTYKILFVLIGDQYGKNKETTSTLMKRYLLSCGIPSDVINKSIYDKFPYSIVESFEIIHLLLENITYDIFISCPSYDMYNVMTFVKNSGISKKIKPQYICE